MFILYFFVENKLSLLLYSRTVQLRDKRYRDQEYNVQWKLNGIRCDKAFGGRRYAIVYTMERAKAD